MKVSDNRDRFGDRFGFIAMFTMVLTLASPIAFGHPGHGPADSAVASFSHIVGGLDHLLFYIAVGIFASRRQFAAAIKFTAIAGGLVLAVVHLAPAGIAMLGGAAIAGAIMAAGFGLGRSVDYWTASKSVS